MKLTVASSPHIRGDFRTSRLMLDVVLALTPALIVGCVVSFVVSLLVIKGLMEYVRSHSFKVFGIYRIVLGVLVLGYFVIRAL